MDKLRNGGFVDTKKGKRRILAQVLVAFGQGTGLVRVSRKACGELLRHYEPLIEELIESSWDHDGVQALERVRSTGRLAVHRMTLKGRTFINETDVVEAYTQVERISATSICNRD